KQYLKNVSAQRDCFHVTAVRLPDGLSFVIYEFWDGEEEWKRHLQSAPNKSFQHVKPSPAPPGRSAPAEQTTPLSRIRCQIDMQTQEKQKREPLTTVHLVPTSPGRDLRWMILA
ncbi:unnamed protein product, partial [Menidia menidia]